MADIYGSHFEYGGISSRKYGLIIANLSTTRNTSVSGDINGVTVFNKATKARHLIEDDYSSSPMSIPVDIVIDGDCPIGREERREIEKWLFNRHEYIPLYLDVEDDCYGDTYEVIDGIQKRLYFNCRFVNPTRLEYNGGVSGYSVTMETDIGMWWQDSIIKTFEPDTSSPSVITVEVDTDLDDFTYPKVTITTGEIGGTISIVNSSDDSSRLTKFVELPAHSTFVIDGNVNFVTRVYYSKFYNRNFPRLVDGENQISIIGDVSAITFEYQNRRFL